MLLLAFIELDMTYDFCMIWHIIWQMTDIDHKEPLLIMTCMSFKVHLMVEDTRSLGKTAQFLMQLLTIAWDPEHGRHQWFRGYLASNILVKGGGQTVGEGAVLAPGAGLQRRQRRGWGRGGGHRVKLHVGDLHSCNSGQLGSIASLSPALVNRSYLDNGEMEN